MLSRHSGLDPESLHQSIPAGNTRTVPGPPCGLSLFPTRLKWASGKQSPAREASQAQSHVSQQRLSCFFRRIDLPLQQTKNQFPMRRALLVSLLLVCCGQVRLPAQDVKAVPDTVKIPEALRSGPGFGPNQFNFISWPDRVVEPAPDAARMTRYKDLFNRANHSTEDLRGNRFITNISVAVDMQNRYPVAESTSSRITLYPLSGHYWNGYDIISTMAHEIGHILDWRSGLLNNSLYNKKPGYFEKRADAFAKEHWSYGYISNNKTREYEEHARIYGF